MGVDRLVAAPHQQLAAGLVTDRVLGGMSGGLTHQHRTRICRGLKPGGDVDHVAHRRVVAAGPQGANQHLARVHPHPHANLDPGLGGVLLEARLHPERGPHSPFGVVLVGHRRSEQGDDRIAHDLVHPPTEADDIVDQPFEGAVDEVFDLLVIELLGQPGEPDQVGEQHADHPALLGRSADRRPTRWTETRSGWNFGSTRRTLHGPRLRSHRRRRRSGTSTVPRAR